MSIGNLTAIILTIWIGIGQASGQVGGASSFSRSVKLGIFKLESDTITTACPTFSENLKLQNDVCSKLTNIAQANDETMPYRTGVGHLCSAFWESPEFYKTKNSCPVPSKAYGDQNITRTKLVVMSTAEITRFVDRRKSQIADLCCVSDNCRKFIDAVETTYSENSADKTEYYATYLADQNGEALIPASGSKAGHMKLAKQRSRQKDRFQFDSSAIDHELIHACHDFKAQEKALVDPAFLKKRFEVIHEKTRCDIAGLESWVTYYKAFADPVISNPDVLGCFAKLVRQAVNQSSPFPACSTTCAREQLEEAINIYQEIRWAVLAPGKMTNSFVPEFCESLRDSNHPAGADVLECAIRYDPVIRAHMDLQFHCR